MVRELIGAVLLIALFPGCSMLGMIDQNEDCLELVDRSQKQLRFSMQILDSLVIDNLRLKESLDSCRASKNLN